MLSTTQFRDPVDVDSSDHHGNAPARASYSMMIRIGDHTTTVDRVPRDKGLSGLGKRTARWLHGEAAEAPLHTGPPPDQLGPLAGVLVTTNMAGYVSDFAQPGQPLTDDGWTQRASIAGFCSDVICSRLTETISATDLILLREDGSSGVRIPVTTHHGVPSSWVGGVPSLEHFRPSVTDTEMSALLQSWYVTVVDPVWGRNDTLWPLLVRALNAEASDFIRTG